MVGNFERLIPPPNAGFTILLNELKRDLKAGLEDTRYQTAVAHPGSFVRRVHDRTQYLIGKVNMKVLRFFSR